jgi:hypothetical protein
MEKQTWFVWNVSKKINQVFENELDKYESDLQNQLVVSKFKFIYSALFSLEFFEVTIEEIWNVFVLFC